jgi:hypothetical protein
MLEDLINQQWQALTRLVRESKLLGQSKIKTLIERKKQRQKPSLVDTIGRRRKADALGEYRRRFASTDGKTTVVPPPMPVAPQGFSEPPQAPLEPFTPPPPAIVRAPPFESLKAPPPSPVKVTPPEPLRGPQPPAESPTLPERVQKAERQRRRLKAANQNGHRRPSPGLGSRLSHWLGETVNNLPPSLAHDLRVLRQRRTELIAATAACVAVFGGAYFYHGPNADRSKPVQVTHAVPPPAREPEKIIMEERPKKPAGPNNKAYYDRLLPEAAETASEPPAASATAATVTEAPKNSEPAAQEKAAQPALDKPHDEQLASAAAPAEKAAPVAVAAPAVALAEVSASAPITAPAAIAAATPAMAPTAIAASDLAADRPTWVKSERYLPDGTRTDARRPAAGALPGEGEARRPVMAAVQPAPAMPGEAPEKTGSAAATSTQAAALAPAPAEAAQTALTGYFAQVKSDQNLKAAEAELAAVAEKYKGVLGDMPLITRSADLKDRGIWFRVLIGPVKSHDEAENVCKRLKGAGLQDCIVQKLD